MMALLSISPSALSSCKPTKHYIKLSNKAFPITVGKIRPKNAIINQAFTNVEGVSRRIGNHHPNLWDDDFIQSLPKNPYEAPYYSELAEKLIGEVRDMFNALAAAQIGTFCAENIYERLVMVDSIERLGIDRHFQKEITEQLDYVFRYWKKCDKDLNTTALGLRILRLHRYEISSEVLEEFKSKNGGFFCSITQSENEIKSVLNLFRASLIAFPKENVMDEAKAFATAYLNQALQNSEISSNLSREITFNLEYGWYTNLPRLEARNYIDIFGENISWNKMANNNKLLYLAKLDFNIVQSIHQRELKDLSRWWMDSSFTKLNFTRHRYVEYHFGACAICSHPKYVSFRNTFAKTCILGTYLDDIYDTYGTLEELKLFTTAIKRWEPLPPNFLPQYMQIVYLEFYKSVNQSARDAEKIQGRDMLDYIQKAWEFYIDAIMQEAEWIATGYIPTLEEYLNNGKVSFGARMAILPSILTLDAYLPENILHKIDYPSRFDDLCGVTLRLRGDTRNFKDEERRGEVASSITSYIRCHPGSSEEDALYYIEDLLDKRLKEFNWEYLKQDNVPACCKDHSYNVSRCFQLYYRERDGISYSKNDTMKHATQILIEPVAM